MNLVIALIITGLLLIGIIGGIISIYNRLVMLNFNVDKSYANLGVLLKQRVDEIPNLVKVVQENMQYESHLLEQITAIRTRFLNTQMVNEKIELSNEMEKAMKSIFAISENYPDLKANQGFLDLQSRVSKIEDMIADRREFFNESVNMYNIGIHEFPNLILAKMFGYKDKTLLQISEQEKQYDGIQF